MIMLSYQYGSFTWIWNPLYYICSISYSGHIFVWIMLTIFPSDPLGTCWKISRSNFWKSSNKNLFHLNLRGFESRQGHLSFITYLLLIMTIVLFCLGFFLVWVIFVLEYQKLPYLNFAHIWMGSKYCEMYRLIPIIFKSTGLRNLWKP